MKPTNYTESLFVEETFTENIDDQLNLVLEFYSVHLALAID